MARYYFRIINDIEVDDAEGHEFDILANARQYAVACARDLAAHDVRHGAVNLNHRIVVEGDAHEKILMVTFRDAFSITY